MLDEREVYPFGFYDDVAGLGYSIKYYLSCIQPKLKNPINIMMDWSDLESNKKEIKNYIINDNSIWLDHIVIEITK